MGVSLSLVEGERSALLFSMDQTCPASPECVVEGQGNGGNIDWGLRQTVVPSEFQKQTETKTNVKRESERRSFKLRGGAVVYGQSYQGLCFMMFHVSESTLLTGISLNFTGCFERTDAIDRGKSGMENAAKPERSVFRSKGVCEIKQLRTDFRKQN